MERDRRDGAAPQQQHGTEDTQPHQLQQLLTRAGQGDAAAAHQLKRLRDRRAVSRASAEAASGGAMHPSVAALFRGDDKSTDQEMGTGAHDVAMQADTMRVALQKHFDDFHVAVLTATKIVTGALAGFGKVKRTPDAVERIGKLAKLAIGLAWKQCGGGAELTAILKLAKEQVLGPYAEYAEKGSEFMRQQLEKHASAEVSVDEITKGLALTVTENATAFISRGKASVARAPATELAQSWRLIGGTRDNGTTSDGTKYDGQEKEKVTTEMLEAMTGIQVSGAFAKSLAATILQQAQADFAQLTGPEGRTRAIADALHGDVGGRVERVARETGEAQWMDEDAAARSRLHQ